MNSELETYKVTVYFTLEKEEEFFDTEELPEHEFTTFVTLHEAAPLYTVLDIAEERFEEYSTEFGTEVLDIREEVA